MEEEEEETATKDAESEEEEVEGEAVLAPPAVGFAMADAFVEF